jgi:hypothetical protein
MSDQQDEISLSPTERVRVESFRHQLGLALKRITETPSDPPDPIPSDSLKVQPVSQNRKEHRQ